MAHPTGIEPSEALKKLIAKALKGSLRYLKVTIENEALEPAGSHEPGGTWDHDMDIMIPPLLDEKSPCYIFYRLDDRNAHQNYLWIFMSFIPEFANVRDKMVYAATKATVRKAFTSAVIVDDISATHQEELSLKGYRHHLESQKAAPPLTEAEQHLKELNENEDHADIGTSTRHSHLHGVAFPIERDALDALAELKRSRLGYVQLSVDVKDERILLDRTEVDVLPDSLPSVVPEGSPRYHFFRYKHTYEGDYQESIVFIYSCPGFKSSIKERMLYSSCKEPVVNVVEQDLGLTIHKKIEIDNGKELNDAFLMDELHPQTQAYRPKFLKPPPPKKRSRSPNRARSPQNSD